MKMKLVSFVILCALLLVPTIAFAANGNVVYGFTSGRLYSTIDAVVGLISAVIGGLSLRRSTRRIGNGGRNGAIVAGVVGLTSMVLAGITLARSRRNRLTRPWC